MELIVILVTIAACLYFALGYKDKQTMAYLQADLYAFPIIDNDPTIIPESIITPKQQELTICTQCRQSELYCSCNLCPGCAKEWEACDCMEFWLANNS